jgi:hypothetical protein
MGGSKQGTERVARRVIPDPLRPPTREDAMDDSTRELVNKSAYMLIGLFGGYLFAKAKGRWPTVLAVAIIIVAMLVVFWANPILQIVFGRAISNPLVQFVGYIVLLGSLLTSICLIERRRIKKDADEESQRTSKENMAREKRMSEEETERVRLRSVEDDERRKRRGEEEAELKRRREEWDLRQKEEANERKCLWDKEDARRKEIDRLSRIGSPKRQEYVIELQKRIKTETDPIRLAEWKEALSLVARIESDYLKAQEKA